jgi:4'-phosphopantetheinyl transferase EntD
MYGDDDKSTGSPEKYTKEQFQKMEKERYAEEARQNAERDKAIEKHKAANRAAQEALKKYGITPRPGFDPNGPNLPDNVDRPSTTRAKYAASGSGAAGSGLDIEGKTGRNVKPKLRAGGMVSSASKRADGCAIRGKTKGRMV